MHNDTRARRHASWWAFLVHRVSGVLLTIFLPIHFWTLGHALQGEAALQSTLKWYENPLFKFGEWALVLLLTAHALGGIRLLLIEFRPWQGLRRGWIAAAGLVALAVSLIFLNATLN
jgi:fumarate reductase subunit D